MMHYSEDAQERLEMIWDALQESKSDILPEEAGHSEELSELSRLGLVSQNGRGFILTTAGKAEAAMAVRRHRLAERLLADVLATEDALVDERACGLEHAL